MFFVKLRLFCHSHKLFNKCTLFEDGCVVRSLILWWYKDLKLIIKPRRLDERNLSYVKGIKKGAQTHKATGQPEPIDADVQLLYCCEAPL